MQIWREHPSRFFVCADECSCGILVFMEDTLVFDIETKKSFAEVGGDRNVRELGVSMLCLFSYVKNSSFAFEEHQLPRFVEMLSQAEHVIGFNIKQFDIPVLEPYMDTKLFSRLAITDIFEDVVSFTGHRVGLNALAKATLGVKKSGHG